MATETIGTLDYNEIVFPKLGIDLHVNSTAFSIGGLDIQWYGILITLGLVLAMIYAFTQVKKYGLNPDRGDPEKSYHFEIVCASMGKAQQIQKIMRCFALDAKIVSRKKSFVVYLKEGAQIVDVLNVMEAHQSLMELENIRILKDMRNTVNRKVNCETANINKTVSAAVKQIDDIRYIEETKGLDKLPEGLKDMALTRLTYPEASLKELGALLQNPVGKSGVNHRLRKLSEMAEEIRAKQGGTL